MNNEMPPKPAEFGETKLPYALTPLLKIFLVILCISIISAIGLFFWHTQQTEPGTVDTNNTATTSSAINEIVTFRDIQGNVVPSLSLPPRTHELKGYAASLPEGDYLYNQDENFVFRMGRNWDVTPSIDVTLPRRITDPQFILRHASNKCYIAFAKFDFGKANGDEYQQSTYQHNFPGVYSSIIINRGIDVEHLPTDFDFVGATMTAPYVPYEIANSRIRFGVTGREFILFAPGNEIVSEDCSEDFSSMLRTIEPYFASITLNENSTGYLTLEHQYVDESRSNEKPFYRLLFSENQDLFNRKLISAIPANSSPIDATIYKNNLYYIDYGKGVMRHEMATGEKTLLVKNNKTGDSTNEAPRINSFYIYDDRLFYLRGTWCRGYREKCSVSLIESTLSGDGEKELATNLSSRYFIGFNSREQKLYMMYTDGDAGCAWGSSEVYTFSTGSLEKSKPMFSCVDDANNELTMWHDALVLPFKKQKISTPLLGIVSGAVTPITTTSNVRNSHYFTFIDPTH